MLLSIIINSKNIIIYIIYEVIINIQLYSRGCHIIYSYAELSCRCTSVGVIAVAGSIISYSGEGLRAAGWDLAEGGGGGGGGVLHLPLLHLYTNNVTTPTIRPQKSPTMKEHTPDSVIEVVASEIHTHTFITH